MSNPKPFLEPDDIYARIKNLERIVKALHTTPRTLVSGIVAQQILTNETLGTIDASFHDLATVGPTCTVTTGPSGVVVVLASSDYAVQAAAPDAGELGVQIGLVIDGVSPISADIGQAYFFQAASTMLAQTTLAFHRVKTLSPNTSHTVKLRYNVLAGTGSAGAGFFNRTLVCVPI